MHARGCARARVSVSVSVCVCACYKDSNNLDIVYTNSFTLAAETIFTGQVEEASLTSSTGPSLCVLLTIAVPSHDSVSYRPLGTIAIIQHSS